MDEGKRGMTYQGDHRAYEAALRAAPEARGEGGADRGEVRSGPRGESRAGPLRPCRLEGRLYE